MPRVLGLFQSQFRVERTIEALKRYGFTPEEIGVILFSSSPSRNKLLGIRGWLLRGGILGDTMDQTDGVSTMDGITVAASIGGLVGIVWGSRLDWGPIAWAVIGLLGGGLVGLIIDRLVPEQRRDIYETKKLKGLMQVEVTALTTERALKAKRILETNEADQIAVIPAGEGGRPAHP